MKRHAQRSRPTGIASRSGIARGLNAAATPASSVRAKGTAAPSRLLLAALAALLALVIAVASAGASKGVHTYFGTQGSGDGEFNTPNGLAVNESGAGAANPGDVYVVDEGNNRIERFDAEGNYLAQFGTPGASAGQLSSPQDIAVDQATGDLYVSEAGNLRVQKFDAAGNFIWMAGAGVNTGTGNPDICTSAGAPTDVCGAGTSGTLGAQFGSLAGIALAPPGSPNAGNLLVADPANSRVQELSSAGAFLRAFGWDVNAPDGDEAFEECTTAADCLAGDPGEEVSGKFESNTPTAIAEDSTGAIYALERRGHIQKFTPQAGPPALNPQGAFDPADLTGGGARPLFDLQIGASNHVFVLREVAEGASTCPDGSSSPEESHILEVDSAGTLQDTHIACAGLFFINGFGLSATTGTAYLSQGSRVLVIDEAIVPPSAIALPQSDVTANSATLHGTVNPNGTAPGDQTSYSFELSADGGSTWTRLASQDAGTGTSDVPASFAATGLEPHTEYRFRLVAAKAFGNPAATSAPLTFTTDALAPEAEPGTTTANDTSAVLHARLNPHNSATTYHFDYGPTDSYGSSTPEAAGGSGGKPHIVGAQIKGLSPDTTYHYRIVATSSGGSATGPDRTLVTGPGFGEDRAYEMVSPSQKLGNDIVMDGSRTKAAADGSALQFYSLGAFGDAVGTGITTEYMAVRGNDAWQTHSLTPLHKPQPGKYGASATFDPHYVGEFSADLDTGVYLSLTPLTGASGIGDIESLYLAHGLRQPGPDSYDLLAAPVGPFISGPRRGSNFFGASSDLSHVIFTSILALTPDAPSQPFPPFCALISSYCEKALYEHTPAGTRLVGKIPVAPATTCSGVECVVAPRSYPGRGLSLPSYGTADSISSDGRRIFFVAADAPLGEAGNLYMREDGTTTVQINAPETAYPLSGPAIFSAASSDGSKVFFTSGQQLYRYDVDAPADHHLTRVSANQTPGGASGSALNVYDASDDGSYVYFTDTVQLVAGEPQIPTGENGVFSWHDGELAFVGVTTGTDDGYNDEPAWSLGLKSTRVTPDGKHLAFISTSPNQPTGDSSSDDCPNSGSFACYRLYVYNAAANGGEGELACASCPPDGSPAGNNATLAPRVGTGGAQASPHLNHALSDDGRLAFFSSADRLVPDDVNGRIDTYSYNTETGQLHLISTGRANENSYFLEATPNGSDVFFATREQLVGWDNDDIIDIYDARIGGGLPEPSPPPPSCQGDACQPPPLNATRPSLATSTSKGPGNQAQKPKKKHRKHKKGRHGKSKKQHHNRANNDRRASR